MVAVPAIVDVAEPDVDDEPACDAVELIEGEVDCVREFVPTIVGDDDGEDDGDPTCVTERLDEAVSDGDTDGLADWAVEEVTDDDDEPA